MAHPFAKHKEEDAGRKRAKEFTKKARGGKVAAYAEGGWVARNPIRDAKEESKPVGKKSGGRLDKFARGGRSKGKKGGNTKINIVVAPHGPHPAVGAAPPAPGDLPPPGGGPMPPPPGGPMGGSPLGGPPGGIPGGPPPGLGGPPGMPPKPPGMMARGGKVKMTAGAETGEGRLQKARKYK